MSQNPKISLRLPKSADIPILLSWFKNPELTPYISNHLPQSKAKAQKWLKRITTADPPTTFVIEVEADGKKEPIGQCGLKEVDLISRKGSFHILIGETQNHGKGYGLEASRLLFNHVFNELNFNRINSSVIDFNEKSLHLHQKLGFKVEGRRRQSIFKNGQFHDEIILGLLKKEWPKKA